VVICALSLCVSLHFLTRASARLLLGIYSSVVKKKFDFPLNFTVMTRDNLVTFWTGLPERSEARITYTSGIHDQCSDPSPPVSGTATSTGATRSILGRCTPAAHGKTCKPLSDKTSILQWAPKCHVHDPARLSCDDASWQKSPSWRLPWAQIADAVVHYGRSCTHPIVLYGI
jgi:hypothetical protein